MPKNQQAFLEALEKLRAAMQRVRDAWEDDIPDDVGSDEYPFEESFDEYPFKMDRWIEAVKTDLQPKKAS